MRGPVVAEAPDLRGSDLALGVLVAAAVVGLTLVSLQVAGLRRRDDLPPIDPGLGVPIAVTPVLDLPARKGDGGGAKVVPSGWARAEGTVEHPVDEVTEPALASAPASTGSARPRSRARPKASGPSLPSLSDLDEPESEGDEVPAGEGASAEPAGESTSSEPTGAGSSSDSAGVGAAGAEGGAGEGEGAAGDPQGLDPLAARAVAQYRDRLSRWLSARFVVHGSGLSRTEIARHRVRAVVRIGADGTVESYTVVPSGNAAFDRAAAEALDSVRGEPLPTPPDAYPAQLQRELHLTFVCKESQCD